MGVPIGRLKNELSKTDFSLYKAFNNIEPFEGRRFDTYVALICDTLARVNGYKRSEMEDFMIDWDVQEQKSGEKQTGQKQSDQELMMVFDSLTTVVNQKYGE